MTTGQKDDYETEMKHTERYRELTQKVRDAPDGHPKELYWLIRASLRGIYEDYWGTEGNK